MLDSKTLIRLGEGKSLANIGICAFGEPYSLISLVKGERDMSTVNGSALVRDGANTSQPTSSVQVLPNTRKMVGQPYYFTQNPPRALTGYNAKAFMHLLVTYGFVIPHYVNSLSPALHVSTYGHTYGPARSDAMSHRELGRLVSRTDRC